MTATRRARSRRPITSPASWHCDARNAIGAGQMFVAASTSRQRVAWRASANWRSDAARNKLISASRSDELGTHRPLSAQAARGARDDARRAEPRHQDQRVEPGSRSKRRASKRCRRACSWSAGSARCARASAPIPSRRSSCWPPRGRRRACTRSATACRRSWPRRPSQDEGGRGVGERRRVWRGGRGVLAVDRGDADAVAALASRRPPRRRHVVAS